MKRAMSLILALVMCLSLCACGASTPVYQIGQTISTARAEVTVKDIQSTIALNNLGAWTSSTGHATDTYFTPVDEYEPGNPYAARVGSSLVWFEVEIKNLDRDSIEFDPTFSSEIKFQVDFDGKTYATNSDNTDIGVESFDGQTWHKHDSSNILLLAGSRGYYRMYIEIPKEISDTDTYDLIVSLPNVEGKSDHFVYRVNAETK